MSCEEPCAIFLLDWALVVNRQRRSSSLRVHSLQGRGVVGGDARAMQRLMAVGSLRKGSTMLHGRERLISDWTLIKEAFTRR